MSSEKSAPEKRAILVLSILAIAIAALAWWGRGKASPVDTEMQPLESVKSAVLAYARDEGTAPPDLAALVANDYLEQLPENSAGYPLRYSHLGANTYEVKSFGPDGKEGGFFFKRDHAIQFEIPME